MNPILEQAIRNLSQKKADADECWLWRDDDDGNFRGPDGRTLTASQFATYDKSGAASITLIRLMHDQEEPKP